MAVAVYRGIGIALRRDFLRRVVISVNRALVAAAAPAGNCQQRCTGHWSVNQQRREQADPGRYSPVA
jgi:hypothetical protein